jgi:hypothetical protein
MGDEHRAGLDFARDPGAGDVALAELGRSFRVQVINGSGVTGTSRRSTTRGSRQSRAWSPVHCSAVLSARTSPLG